MAWEDQERLRDIFIKYLDNQCSPAEMAELMEYFREVDNTEKLKEIISYTIHYFLGCTIK